MRVILVAQGCTNAQIAAQLYISIRTVSSHLDRIWDKLPQINPGCPILAGANQNEEEEMDSSTPTRNQTRSSPRGLQMLPGGGNMWKLAAAFALSAGLVFAAAGQASAATPVIGTFPIDDHFVDDGVSAACGFPVTVDLTGTGRFWVFVDALGNPTQVQVHEDATGTMSANGISLQEVDHNTQFIDLAAGTQTQVGIVFREFLPGLGVVIMDRGRLSAAADGTITFEAGPHPALDGNLAALCAALTP